MSETLLMNPIFSMAVAPPAKVTGRVSDARTASISSAPGKKITVPAGNREGSAKAKPGAKFALRLPGTGVTPRRSSNRIS